MARPALGGGSETLKRAGRAPHFFGNGRWIRYNRHAATTVQEGATIAMMSDLASKTCVPCRGGVPPLKGKDLDGYLKQVSGWKAVDEHHLAKTFTFPDFKQALAFVNKVGGVAEEQGHHPAINFTWGKAEITTWTHKIDGLTESDFILAAKIDRL